jgi:signal transduction histidine kinase
MLIVIGAAIVPLAIVGAWLTASAARSGRELLRAELDSSLAEITGRMAERWETRSGELALLANNEPAQRTLRAGQADADATRYFEDLARVLRSSIREFQYRDADGRVRWTSTAATASRELPATQRPVAGLNTYDAIMVRRPVADASGAAIGAVEARVLLSAILPTDSLQRIVAGAALRIRDRETGEVIGGSPRTADGATKVLTQVSLSDPPLDVEMAASDARYVQPFMRAARLGLVSLLAVATLALVVTGILSRQLTASLEQMAEAAVAVAGGDLERNVVGSGADEIGRLATAFNTMTESLRRTLHELSRREALAAVGHFAASISHEVRNAVTSVRLDAQRLHERAADTNDRALAKRLLGNVNRLDSIVTGSLRIARANPETMRPIVLEGVIRTAMTAAEPAFLESGARAMVEVDEQRRDRVRGDAGALEQLFVNLLLNAAQAMGGGGIARVSIEPSDANVVVRIADTGRGISAEDLGRMGEAFFSSKPQGTGLGFSIARQIALVHGGDVRVVATSGAGTTIEVALPRAPIASS